MANFNWHAVHTKLHSEQRVASFLTRKHIKNYCPVHEKERHERDGKKIILEPLFESIVFVWIQDEERSIVRSTTGVLNFVYWLNSPAIITQEDINTIKVILKKYSCVKLEQFPLKICVGEIVESSLLRPAHRTDDSVKVKLTSLGFYLVAYRKKENTAQ